MLTAARLAEIKSGKPTGEAVRALAAEVERLQAARDGSWRMRVEGVADATIEADGETVRGFTLSARSQGKYPVGLVRGGLRGGMIRVSFEGDD